MKREFAYLLSANQPDAVIINESHRWAERVRVHGPLPALTTGRTGSAH